MVQLHSYCEKDDCNNVGINPVSRGDCFIYYCPGHWTQALEERVETLEAELATAQEQLALKLEGLQEVVNMHLEAEGQLIEAKAREVKLVEALEYYADPKFWKTLNEIGGSIDYGEVARAALKETKK